MQPTATQLVLRSVKAIDAFISDPAHTTDAIEDMVRKGYRAERICEVVADWISKAVTTEKGETYAAHPAALARFVRRETAIAAARIACDATDCEEQS